MSAEIRYRMLVEQIPAVTYIAEFSADAPFLYVSPQIEDLLGFPVERWTEDEDLWASGLMDSLMVVELVAALEERYSVQFTPEQLRKENFESVGHIRRTLESSGLQRGR